jgi:hypothetical protein
MAEDADQNLSPPPIMSITTETGYSINVYAAQKQTPVSIRIPRGSQTNGTSYDRLWRRILISMDLIPNSLSQGEEPPKVGIKTRFLTLNYPQAQLTEYLYPTNFELRDRGLPQVSIYRLAFRGSSTIPNASTKL